MKQFTEAEFTAAMEKAVARRGGEWRHPAKTEGRSRGYYHRDTPTYSDEHGNPTCLIGAVLYELGEEVPQHWVRASALGVLGQAFSNRIRIAARVAQIHQDSRNQWGECLMVYRAALTVMDRYGVGEPIWVDAIYHRAVEEVHDRRFEEGAVASTTALSDAMKKVSEHVEVLATMFNGMTLSFMPEVLDLKPLSVTVVPKKSEHALVA
jgi:hypothetical protein